MALPRQAGAGAITMDANPALPGWADSLAGGPPGLEGVWSKRQSFYPQRMSAVSTCSDPAQLSRVLSDAPDRQVYLLPG
jgi:hypothetical protein